jgi:hypothetical protein
MSALCPTPGWPRWTLIARARPEQIARLIADIEALDAPEPRAKEGRA